MGTMAGRRVRGLERGRLTGAGATVKEARVDLEAKVDAALAGSYDPVLISCGAYMAVIWRAPDGWYYRLREFADVRATGLHEVAGGGNYDDRESCVQAAAFHVLDIGSGPDDFHVDADIPAFLAHPGKRSTLLSNARFHRAYAHARANGLGAGDDDWHRWACDHSRDPEFS
jgi:hypothetical protein